MLEILEGGKGFLISDFPKFKLINHHALSLSTPRSHSSLSFLIAIYLSARLSWHYVKGLCNNYQEGGGGVLK